jgi:hypothetical protein
LAETSLFLRRRPVVWTKCAYFSEDDQLLPKATSFFGVAAHALFLTGSQVATATRCGGIDGIDGIDGMDDFFQHEGSKGTQDGMTKSE